MSRIIIEDEGWKAIMADPELARARRKLSFHEIRLIVQHARDSASGPQGENSRSEVEGEAPQSGGEAASPNPSSSSPDPIQ